MKNEKEEEMLRKKLKPRSNYNTGLCTGSNFNGRGTWVAIRNRLHLDWMHVEKNNAYNVMRRETMFLIWRRIENTNFDLRTEWEKAQENRATMTTCRIG